MTKSAFHRLSSTALLLIFCWYAPAVTAQQAKPVAAKAAAKTGSATLCMKKGGACCKGTPTRAAVLAINLLKVKPVKR